MTKAEYLRALEKLKLSPYGVETAAALGMSVDGIAKLARGATTVRPTLEKLLRMYLRFGVPRGI